MSRMSERDIERANGRKDVGLVGELLARAILASRIDLALHEFAQMTEDAAAKLFATARMGLVAENADHITEAEAMETGRQLRAIVADLLDAREQVARIMAARQKALAAPVGLGTCGTATESYEDPQPAEEA